MIRDEVILYAFPINQTKLPVPGSPGFESDQILRLCLQHRILKAGLFCIWLF